MSKNVNYSKHQRSSKKKIVMTLSNGKVFQGDTEEEALKLVKQYEATKNITLSDPVKPKFDPDTGERIN